MAHFYGTVKGGRGEAHRVGHKSTGLTVTAATWSYRVVTSLWHDSDSGEDMVSVYIGGMDGRTINVLYEGPIGGEKPAPTMIEPVFTLEEIEKAKAEIAGA